MARRIYSLEWFERIESLRAKVAELSAQVESAYASAGPHGQQMGSIGGCGKRDALVGVDAIIDADASAKLERLNAKLEGRLEQATNVLYGKSGRGGVAKAIGSDEADMLCWHYLQGESWASISKRLSPDAKNPTDWCKYWVRSACRQIDRIGMDVLAES